MPNDNIAHRRLLDMLAGWADFVEESVWASDADAIYDLYQEVGKWDNPTNSDIDDFLKTKVLRLLLCGVDNEQTNDKTKVLRLLLCEVDNEQTND